MSVRFLQVYMKARQLIESSTAWKLASRVRSAFQNYPTVRRYGRRLARVVWWTVTLQLVGRLRARRRLFKMRDMIANSAFFDAAWYLSQYSGIAEAGCDPALHYALYGATERRNPGPRFDAEVYLLRYPDVAEAGMNPLIHYLEHGAGEGRVITSVRKSSPSNDYRNWVECYDSIRDEDRAAITRHIGLLRDRPLFSVVMPVYNTRPTFLRKALDSIRAQLYPDWELCIADDASSNPDVRAILNDYARRDRRIQLVCRNENGHISAASNSALELATGAFIVLMDHDDELSEHALYMVALTLNEYPESDIIYSDEDKLDDEGRRHGPYFKTDWNPELFYSQNMISHLGVYRASLVRQVGGFREGYEGSQDYDLALRVLAQSTYNRVRHIPHVLYHWRIGDGLQTYSTANMPVAVQAARRALTDYFASRGERVIMTESNIPYWNRVKRIAPDPPPLVSLIVPTRDKVNVLRTCIDGLLYKTRYPNLEIIIVDNESREPETLAYFESLKTEETRIHVLRIDGPFNYSALNNRAVQIASGELVGFINNDIEVFDPGWIEELVSQVVWPGVGAVGAKLYYGDGTIQHAGVILGLGGVAGHPYTRSPDHQGYLGRLQLVCNVSCVTAACMLMPKHVFHEVGGFDEVNLPIAYNDVDLCLRLREAGYSIVWTPYAELVHLESASRGSDRDNRDWRVDPEISHMRKRWGALLEHDPFYSPNLSLATENFDLAFPPRVSKPWLVTSKRENGQLNAFEQVGGR